MLSTPAISIILLLLGASSSLAGAFAPDRLDLERRFNRTVQPFLETYCFSCHGKEKQKGKLDLSRYSKMQDVALDHRPWEIVLEKLKAEEMPPEEAKRHPTADLRRGIIDWILAMRKHEAQRNAGDPGPVPARRLSNAEFDYSIRDLTGVDIRPAREFPVDPANEAGFDNSAESLMMSPVLLKKYLEAARGVAEHIVLKPEGFVFAPHPVVSETDRDKYCVKRIVDFYQRQPTDYADYFLAAWQFRNRAALHELQRRAGVPPAQRAPSRERDLRVVLLDGTGETPALLWAVHNPKASLAEFAIDAGISPKYLATIWSVLENNKEEVGPIAALQTMWRELPMPNGNPEDTARRGCERMRNFVVSLRQKLSPEFNNLSLRGIAPGSQPLVLWKDRQFATNRMRFTRGTLYTNSNPKLKRDPTLDAIAGQVLAMSADKAARERDEPAFDRFCHVFPDAFFVSERGRVFLEEEKENRGRLLSAGFHLMTGYFRDDEPLCQLILDEQGQRELDALWQELNFIAFAPMRQYKDFIFFERAEPPRFMQGAEFDFARSEDKNVTSAPKIQQLAAAYLAKARRNASNSPAIQAIEHYFRTITAEIHWVEQARLAAEPSHLKALQSFAERAYRRPLSRAERDEILLFYRSLREKDGLGHEDAMRDTVASVLMSPNFCYRIDLAGTTPQASPPNPPSFRRAGSSRRAGEVQPAAAEAPGAQALKWSPQPLSDYDLTSRLSYFLWSSMPDKELLDRAAAGDLHRPEVLLRQARRMVQDDRVRGLATEFGANWLDFRRFEEHNAVDRERFKSFTPELRQAMFEEPIRFFVDLVREDRPVLDFLYADHTFVTPLLARHYGMTGFDVRSNEWVRVDDAHRYERGGLLTMSVFLTRNSPGLRTSPVKRGYWVVRRLLGERIPPPPANVPELPNDEAKLGDFTLRETLARHREDKSCAGCHARFDSIGLVYEGYGPVGELRTKDFGGRLVDTRATFPGGSEGAGLDGLRHYLREHRQEEFLDNLCRKLLAYGLGRGLLLSDDAILRDMRAKLAANENRFGSLLETIVTSPQFLTRRGQDDLTKR